MLHKDAAQQRPGNQPAPAPEASHKLPRAQKQANSEIPVSQRMNSQPGDTTAADMTAGNMDTSHTSLIHGGPRPLPPWNPTPYTTTPTLQQVLDPTKNGRVQHERMTWLARYHPFGEGHEQAGRSSPLPRRDSTPHATTTTLQRSHDPTTNTKFKLKGRTRHARQPPLGEGYEQAGSARAEQGIGQKQQPRLTIKDRQKIPAERKSPQEHGSVNFKIPTLKRARNQTGDINAVSHMGRDEDIRGIIHIRARHTPPPRLDLTTHATIPALQTRNDPTKTVSHQTRLSRYRYLEDGHEHPQPAPKLVQGTALGPLPKHEQKVPQQVSVQNLQPEESTEPGRGAESYPISCTDLPPHTASPVPCTPLTQPLDQDSDVPQQFSYEKYQQTERTRGRAQHHPSGDAHGHTNAYIALGREGSHVAQCLATHADHVPYNLPRGDIISPDWDFTHQKRHP